MRGKLVESIEDIVLNARPKIGKNAIRADREIYIPRRVATTTTVRGEYYRSFEKITETDFLTNFIKLSLPTYLYKRTTLLRSLIQAGGRKYQPPSASGKIVGRGASGEQGIEECRHQKQKCGHRAAQNNSTPIGIIHNPIFQWRAVEGSGNWTPFPNPLPPAPGGGEGGSSA